MTEDKDTSVVTAYIEAYFTFIQYVSIGIEALLVATTRVLLYPVIAVYEETMDEIKTRKKRLEAQEAIKDYDID